jgi:hypothetical protein
MPPLDHLAWLLRTVSRFFHDRAHVQVASRFLQRYEWSPKRD